LNIYEIGAQRDEFASDDAVPCLRFSPDAQEAFSHWRAGLDADWLASDEVASGQQGGRPSTQGRSAGLEPPHSR